ncbi:MAG TPA: hypothetical protein VGN85_11445 [Methyloceanibacter sp.]|nr:hypothetical protein [Methyloceanibacter sp.]
MSALRLGLAAWAVLVCSGPALAFKNLQACDIVMFASGAAPSEIAPEAWFAYRDEMVTLLSGAHGAGDANATQAMADRVIEAQNSLLAPVADSDAYKDYLAGGSCLVLKSLTNDGVEAALAAIDPSTPATAVQNARALANAARMQVDMISRSARFRSNLDKTLLAARYYCFAAGVIQALVASDKQTRISLGTYGTAIGCKDAGRVE